MWIKGTIPEWPVWIKVNTRKYESKIYSLSGYRGKRRQWSFLRNEIWSGRWGRERKRRDKILSGCGGRSGQRRSNENKTRTTLKWTLKAKVSISSASNVTDERWTGAINTPEQRTRERQSRSSDQINSHRWIISWMTPITEHHRAFYTRRGKLLPAECFNEGQPRRWEGAQCILINTHRESNTQPNKCNTTRRLFTAAIISASSVPLRRQLPITQGREAITIGEPS